MRKMRGKVDFSPTENFVNDRPSFSRLNILDTGSLLHEKRGNSLGNDRDTWSL